jgi:hypothetical protein
VCLRLGPQLLDVAKLLSCLPMAVVPLGLTVVSGLQVSRDPPAIGGREPVTVTAVAMWKCT